MITTRELVHVFSHIIWNSTKDWSLQLFTCLSPPPYVVFLLCISVTAIISYSVKDDRNCLFTICRLLQPMTMCLSYNTWIRWSRSLSGFTPLHWGMYLLANTTVYVLPNLYRTFPMFSQIFCLKIVILHDCFIKTLTDWNCQ